MRVEQFARRHAVGAGHGVAERNVVTQDRDLHFEEFVEVGIGDAQEAQALEQRHARILRLREHAEVEFELRQFAIEVQAADPCRFEFVFGAIHRASSARLSKAAATRSGPKTQANVLPTPTSLSIVSCAWCSCRTCLTIDRPRPVPPVSRERLVETR